MSRVDDDRDEARVAARLAEARKNEELQKTRKAVDGQVFGKLVGQQKAQGQVAQRSSAAKSAIAQLLEAAEQKKAEGAQEGLEQAVTTQGEHQAQEAAQTGRAGQATQGERQQASSRSDGAHSQQGRVSDRQASSASAQSAKGDASAGARSNEGRSASSKSDAKVAGARKESLEGARNQGSGGAAGEKGELKADAEGGGGQGGGKDKDQNNPGAAAANFRFNPALMAPPGVAKPREATGSDRLRKVANELAQKIVERVRVGTNAAGKVEFQIDLRSDVLAGLSVKVSAQNGKIRAVFSGKDRDVLKMIEEQGEALKKALGARGLTLEEFKIEARS